MLVSKTKKDNAINAKYNSSDIQKSIYDVEKKTLILIFKKGNMYMYSPVEEETYKMFEAAPSQGKFLSENIKKDNKIKFTKVTKLKAFELENL